MHVLLQDVSKPRTGTRSASKPEGDGSVAKEILGNTLCRATVRICEHLHSKGGLFSVEKPPASWLFRQPSFLRLLRREEFSWWFTSISAHMA